MDTQKMKKQIIFVTGNKGKLLEATQIMKDTNISLSNRDIDLPELQGELKEVAREKCRLAYQEINQSTQNPVSVLVEDTALEFCALNGMPGVYIKWFLKAIGHKGLNKMLDGFDDRSCRSVCTLAYWEAGKDEPLIFQGTCDGQVVQPRPVEGGFGWDPIFQVNEKNTKVYGKTFGEISKEEKNEVSHRRRAFQQFADYFKDAQL